jgi:predicted SnoaL-like aldol condensation-catalyzing enzyme
MGGAVTDGHALGEHAHRVLMDIYRSKDATVIERDFDSSLVQHDPNVADGIEGLKSYIAVVASSPDADITIHRTLVDGDVVAIHSTYEGLSAAPGPLLAFDLFRFDGDRIVEHWGGQQPATSELNLGGHSQVDGPSAVEDQDKTEANRAFMKNYRNVITVQKQYQRLDDYLTVDYAQHAEGLGDGIERVKARYAKDVKPGTSNVLTPRYFVADGNFVLSVVDAKTDPPKANFDLFRIADGKVAEHWEVLSVIPPPDERKNTNDPFAFDESDNKGGV